MYLFLFSSKQFFIIIKILFLPVAVAVGVCGLGIWKRHPSEGVGGNRGPTSTDVGVLGPDTLECGRSEPGPGNPLSNVVGNTLKSQKLLTMNLLVVFGKP